MRQPIDGVGRDFLNFRDYLMIEMTPKVTDRCHLNSTEGFFRIFRIFRILQD